MWKATITNKTGVDESGYFDLTIIVSMDNETIANRPVHTKPDCYVNDIQVILSDLKNQYDSVKAVKIGEEITL